MPDSEAVPPTQLEEPATSSSLPTQLEASREGRPSKQEGSAGRESPVPRTEVEPQSGISHQSSNAPWAVLPDELAESYECVRQSSVVGAEGILFEVIETDTRIPRILKLYHKGVTLKPESLRRIQTIKSNRVIRLIDFAQLNDGRWYEIQERIECGSLMEYRQKMGGALEGVVLEKVIEQLSRAVAVLHKAGIAHQDIKPENVLVRGERPLELVLTDFGLSVVADNRTYYATNRDATIAYQPPETMRGLGGEPRDYWALGLTIAALATGGTPYEGLNLHGILDQHYRRIPPQIVESISDRRLKQLCRGLTRYDPKSRWTIRDIQNWLDGMGSKVGTETPTSVPRGPRVVFNERVFVEEKALGNEIAQCWTAAAQILGVSSRRIPFVEQLFNTFGTERIAQLKGRWEDNPPSLNRIDYAIVELIVALNPGQQPCYGARHLTKESILAASVSDSQEDRDFIEKLQTSRILEAWADLSDNSDLAQIAEEWRIALRRAEEIARIVGNRGTESFSVPELRGSLLAVSVDARAQKQWREMLEKKRPRGRLLPSWYDPIAKRSDPADVVAAVSLASEARRAQKANMKRYNAAKYERIRGRWRRISTVMTASSWVLWTASLPLDWMTESEELFHGVLGLLLVLHTLASGRALQIIPGTLASGWVLVWFLLNGIDVDSFELTAEHSALAAAVLATLSSVCSLYVVNRGRVLGSQSAVAEGRATSEEAETG